MFPGSIFSGIICARFVKSLRAIIITRLSGFSKPFANVHFSTQIIMLPLYIPRILSVVVTIKPACLDPTGLHWVTRNFDGIATYTPFNFVIRSWGP